MPSVFLTSDTHFGHLGVCKFLCADGVTKIRPWTDPDEMDEDMVALWNDRVGPKDKVYHLGDVVINRKSLSILDRLNGDKVLIKGNHDIFKLGDYTRYFRDIRSYHVMNGLILSHIPLHLESLYRFGCNIHGHLHQNRVMRKNQYGQAEIDPNYWCACVEHTDFAPILFEDVLKKIKEQGGVVGFKNGNYGHGMAD
jgi:calcineurin-like phosphoesterase family protein